jgi:hypothetical protein
MKPAWDKLMKEYEGHDSAGVFDVDCTAEGKPLCDSNGVRGFPTIKYGSPDDLQNYEGGRDFDALLKFAQENLKPSCGPANIDLCDDEKKAEIAKFSDMSDDDLDAFIKEKSDAIETAEQTFKDEVSKLQKTYEGLMEAKDATVEEVTNSGLGLAKSVRAFKKSGAKEEL